MFLPTSNDPLKCSEMKTSLIQRIRTVSTLGKTNSQSKEADKTALASTVNFSYDLIREINRLNKRLSEASEPGLKTAIKNEVKELISLVEVLSEILVLYKSKDKESIDPLKKKLSHVLQHPFETVEV